MHAAVGADAIAAHIAARRDFDAEKRSKTVAASGALFDAARAALPVPESSRVCLVCSQPLTAGHAEYLAAISQACTNLDSMAETLAEMPHMLPLVEAQLHGILENLQSSFATSFSEGCCAPRCVMAARQASGSGDLIKNID
jgi:hypothetical protein